MSLGGSAQKVFTTRTITNALTRPSNTTTYASGDVISANSTNAHYTFSEIVEERAAMICSATLHCSTTETLQLAADLILFRTDIAAVADNAPATISDAEMLTAVGVISFPAAGWTVGGANASCFITGLNILFSDDGSSRKLYGQLVARNAYIPASAAVFTVDLIVSQD